MVTGNLKINAKSKTKSNANSLPIEREKSIENRIKNYLKKNNIYYFKVHGNGFQKVGIPDIVACINGKFTGIEVKRPGGKPSPLQIANIEQIRNNGGSAEIVYSFEEAKQFIDSVLGKKDSVRERTK